MSKDTDGGEAQLRVRIPLGSPSQPTNEVGTSPDCTELRSVSNDENRPITRRPAPGDIIEVLPDELFRHGQGAEPAWVLARVQEVGIGEASFLADVDGTPYARSWREEGSSWRWPACVCPFPRDLCPICEHDCAACRAERPAIPEPRRCTAPITDAGEAGAVVDLCGAILGRDLACELCEGQRCYQHCASIDHFPGVQERGHYDGEDKPVWKIRRIDDGRYRGQLLRFVDGKLQIVATVAGATGDDVQRDLEQRQRELSWAAPAPAPAQPTAVPLPVLGEFVEKVPRGPLGRDKRAELLEEVIAWLRSCDAQWVELSGMHWRGGVSFEAAKALHDQQIVELFSRLAGAL